MYTEPKSYPLFVELDGEIVEYVNNEHKYNVVGLRKLALELLRHMDSVKNVYSTMTIDERFNYSNNRNKLYSWLVELKPSKEGEAKVTKRIRKQFKKQMGFDISELGQEYLSIFGERLKAIESEETSVYVRFDEGVDTDISIDSDEDEVADRYVNYDSCWFSLDGMYGYSRYYLNSNSGGSVRFYNTMYDAIHTTETQARMWYLPYGTGVLLFNVYGSDDSDEYADINLRRATTIVHESIVQYMKEKEKDTSVVSWGNNYKNIAIAGVGRGKFYINDGSSTTYIGEKPQFNYLRVPLPDDVVTRLHRCENCGETIDGEVYIVCSSVFFNDAFCEYCFDNHTQYDEVREERVAYDVESVYVDGELLDTNVTWLRENHYVVIDNMNYVMRDSGVEVIPDEDRNIYAFSRGSDGVYNGEEITVDSFVDIAIIKATVGSGRDTITAWVLIDDEDMVERFLEEHYYCSECGFYHNRKGVYAVQEQAGKDVEVCHRGYARMLSRLGLRQEQLELQYHSRFY